MALILTFTNKASVKYLNENANKQCIMYYAILKISVKCGAFKCSSLNFMLWKWEQTLNSLKSR